MSVKSADDIIVQEESKKLGREIPVAEAAPVEDTAIEAPEPDDPAPNAEPAELPLAAEADTDETEDDYGNKVSKPKMYSEEEVQRMIRERLSRGRQTQPEQEQVQEAAKDFKADPESEESWETQLGDFVENKIAQIEQKRQQKAWQEQEKLSQDDFEEKFTSGMGKYHDFENVVKGKPITASMMMATRSMENPAAFLYAACKQQPAEIDRIAKIQDPYAQIAEMGRLEERMKKSRVLTAAPKPAKRISGDRTDDAPRQSIDSLIAQHAKDKIMITRPSR
jgi:hypothetical protein